MLQNNDFCTLSNLFISVINFAGLLVMAFICYFTSVPRADTSTFNTLFLAFNVLMIAQIMALVLAVANFNGQYKVMNWYIGFELATILSCSFSTCLWTSHKKDGFKRYVTPVDPKNLHLDN